MQGKFRTVSVATELGLTPKMFEDAIQYVYDVLDAIDTQLVANGSEPLANLLEYANFSAIIGNLLREGISRASGGVFKANGPHKYPDLLNTLDSKHDLEIKVAMEDNSPKGHLAKSGYHLTARYVLCDDKGVFTLGKRGVMPRIVELRIGYLDETKHFNCSNTAGDSGKTACINAAGLGSMQVAYYDLARAPYSKRGPRYKALEALK